MNNIIKFNILIIILFLFANCTEKIYYSGQIIKDENFDYSTLQHKTELIEYLGYPNYIDPIENKYYYYSEKRKYKNLFDEKIENRIILVFSFNDDDSIKIINKFTLDDENEVEYSNDKTINNIVKRGFIERWFGGVGKSQSGLPTTSQ